MVLWFVLAGAGAVLLSPLAGAALLVGALATFGFYRVSAYRQFGGVTGDGLRRTICSGRAVTDGFS